MKTLEHFTIGESVCGQQEWFTDPWMNRGGCAAVTACDSCIYFARTRGMTELCPFDAQNPTKEAYLAFGEQMRPYLSPRPSGINKTGIYRQGFNAYLADHPGSGLRLRSGDGHAPLETAVDAIRAQIDNGFPVPYLMLLHHDTALDDFMWHWFLLNGYDDPGNSFLVRAVTYGKETWLDLPSLWDTRRTQKGGFIIFSVK